MNILITTAVTLSALVLAHTYEPTLMFDKYMSHGLTIAHEDLAVELEPHPRSSVNKGTVKCLFEMNWYRHDKYLVKEFTQVIEKCWKDAVDGDMVVDNRQIKKLTSDQIRTLFYRHKHYNNGTIKFKYVIRDMENARVELHPDQPPITPGEYRCMKYHHASARRLYLLRKAAIEEYLKYFEDIGEECTVEVEYEEIVEKASVHEHEEEANNMERLIDELIRLKAELNQRLLRNARKMVLTEDESAKAILEKFLLDNPIPLRKPIEVEEYRAVKRTVNYLKQ